LTWKARKQAKIDSPVVAARDRVEVLNCLHPVRQAAFLRSSCSEDFIGSCLTSAVSIMCQLPFSR
jgi:hypothetical protein